MFDADFTPDNEIQYSDISNHRLDTEWMVVSALRETTGIALKGEKYPTYIQTLVLAQQLVPRLFNRDESLLIRQQESDITREYKQVANAQSEVQNVRIDPLILVEEEIARFEELVRTSVEKDRLAQRLSKLYVAQRELQSVAYTEQQLILRDALRSHKEFPVSGTGRDYREFELPSNRALRIRVLHPDVPEHTMGVDVLYENYWDKKRVVRLAAIQYKIWQNKVLYQDERMEKQLEKLNIAFCQSRFCNLREESRRVDAYRLPYCTAFLRPTDKLQSADSRLVSTGYHVPICVIAKSWKEGPRGGRRIVSEEIRSEAVTHRIFEEMFNTNMLGSGYLTYVELEILYREHKILDNTERIVIHAQEFGID